MTNEQIEKVRIYQREYNSIMIKINSILMKTKDKIVERLLEENNITAEEAVVLLKETEYINTNPYIGPNITWPSTDDDMVPYGEICSCNPKNGGSGICGCVMGSKLVPKDFTTNYTQTTTNTAIINKDGCQNTVCYCDGSCKKD